MAATLNGDRSRPYKRPRWSENIPEADEYDGNLGMYRYWALECLNEVLLESSWDSPEEMVAATLDAAANIRAWRRSLPVKSRRMDDYSSHLDDRELLRLAAHNVLWADGEGGVDRVVTLRFAEAALRTIWKRHQPSPVVAGPGIVIPSDEPIHVDYPLVTDEVVRRIIAQLRGGASLHGWAI
jgi:hypothetical protein